MGGSLSLEAPTRNRLHFRLNPRPQQVDTGDEVVNVEGEKVEQESLGHSSSAWWMIFWVVVSNIDIPRFISNDVSNLLSWW